MLLVELRVCGGLAAKGASVSEHLTTRNPASGDIIDTYPLMSREELKSAIESCHRAFSAWKVIEPSARAEIISAIGRTLLAHKAELGDLMTREMGKVRSQCDGEVDLCAAICAYTAQHGPRALASQAVTLDGGGRAKVVYSPQGVVYGIQPWNFPAYQVVRYSIASLMAGNGVLLKHAENVTGSGLLLEKIYLEAGLPRDLFKVLRISHDASDEVIAHPLVRGVTLTGSPDAGRMIAEKAGKHLKKAVLELGSNDAYIVLEDADLDRAVAECVQGRVFNNGETCVAAKRFIVVDAVYDAFLTRFAAAMRDLVVGDPTHPETDVGPMAREDLRAELHEQVQDSLKAGAKLVCGGKLPEGRGYFYPPTVLEDVQPGQPAYDDELFGPVASVIRARSAEDAMRIANDSRFGLGGGIFTRDIEKAERLAADHFDTGMVFINGFGVAHPALPFGGVKDSGYGREHGGFGLKEFVNEKAVRVMHEG
jgi:succinate-semialdehyde dehydrogenase / glutarate-semialdehyde dehydrogenase